MKRLYKFFLLLFLSLLILSAIYGIVISWTTYNILRSSATNGGWIGPIPFSTFIKIGSIQALLYSLVLYLIIILLFKRSVDKERKFTLRNIIAIAGWFFLLTTAVFVIHIIYFSSAWDFNAISLVFGPQFIMPGSLWFPFPIAWLTLYIILASRIKKTE